MNSDQTKGWLLQLSAWLKNTFTAKTNTMNHDQTAPKGAVWYGFILFAIKDTKSLKQMREQTWIVVQIWNRVKYQKKFDHLSVLDK